MKTSLILVIVVIGFGYCYADTIADVNASNSSVTPGRQFEIWTNVILKRGNKLGSGVGSCSACGENIKDQIERIRNIRRKNCKVGNGDDPDDGRLTSTTSTTTTTTTSTPAPWTPPLPREIEWDLTVTSFPQGRREFVEGLIKEMEEKFPIDEQKPGDQKERNNWLRDQLAKRYGTGTWNIIRLPINPSYAITVYPAYEYYGRFSYRGEIWHLFKNQA